ncbi:hypothetical protein [Actinomadura hibisca]|uniref:hypothetical protein n=1 Tax=Actinomadura hibisca TaxID=68565 RepID=UPI00083651AD|nr:hypothetical protein [Actinomadura hibisca]
MPHPRPTTRPPARSAPPRTVLLLGAAALTAAVPVTVSAAPAHAAVTSTSAAAQAPATVFLPPGARALRPGEQCPRFALCLWRDYGRSGPGYALRTLPLLRPRLYRLSDLPMASPLGNARNNVSSWLNNSCSPVRLHDRDAGHWTRTLRPGQALEEPYAFNDTVDEVRILLPTTRHC